MKFANSAESFVLNQRMSIIRLTAPGSEPSFRFVSPFRDALVKTKRIGSMYRVCCPRCNGTGRIDQSWAIKNRYANMGENCFLCTRSGVASGEHPLASVAQLTQVVVQCCFLLAKEHNFRPDSYCQPMIRFLTIDEGKVYGPYQQDMYRVYSTIRDRVQLLADTYAFTGLKDVFPTTPPVLAAVKWMKDSQALQEASDRKVLEAINLRSRNRF